MPDPRPPNEDLSQVQEYRFLGFRLDLAKRCLYGPGGLPVKLKYRAFDTLAVLVAHRGQTLSKPFLMERVWQKTFVEENNLNQAISNLRKALGDSKDNSRFIKTFSGKGYCFVAPVESITRAEMLQGARPPLFDNFKLASGTYALSPEFSRQAAPFFLVLVACVLIYISVVPGLRESQEEFSTLEISQPAPSPVPVIPPVIPDSVAVLPFETVNSGTDGNAFASGFQNELINQLAKVRELNLISREGVLSPMIQELSLAEVGRILRAEHLVTGTILFSNDDATINVQILNPDNGIIAWASSFMLSTSELPDMLSTYSEIALAIAEALRVEVNLDERQRILSQSTESFEAYRYSLADRKSVV